MNLKNRIAKLPHRGDCLCYWDEGGGIVACVNGSEYFACNRDYFMEWMK